MIARRPRLDDASEAYIARVVATFPPFSEKDKLHLSRLVTPPSRVLGITAHEPGSEQLGGRRAAA